LQVLLPTNVELVVRVESWEVVDKPLKKKLIRPPTENEVEEAASAC
jgi:hypothetical protein